MPRKEAFQCPLLSEPPDANVITTMTAVDAARLTHIEDELDETHDLLQDTHRGHELHLWGQAVEGEAEPHE